MVSGCSFFCMTDPKDTKLGVGWRLEKTLGQAKLPKFPCLKCGRETKVHHPIKVMDKKTHQLAEFPQRICSDRRCREIFVIVPKFDFARGIKLAKKRMLTSMQRRSGDAASMSDQTSVGIDTVVRPPVHPCDTCGFETKAHHPIIGKTGVIEAYRRICASPSCRAIETQRMN